MNNKHTELIKVSTVSGNNATICSKRGNRIRASQLPDFIAAIRDVTMTSGNFDSDGQVTCSAVSDNIHINTQHPDNMAIPNIFFRKVVKSSSFCSFHHIF